MSITLTRILAALALPLALTPPSWIGRVASGRVRRRRPATLDLEHAPEPLLRDLGILDGRDPVHPHDGHRGR